jgi:hypothetical protein
MVPHREPVRVIEGGYTVERTLDEASGELPFPVECGLHLSPPGNIHPVSRGEHGRLLFENPAARLE